MLYQNSYFHGNTIIHRIHPVIKFLSLLSIIFLLFLKVSFLIHLSIFTFAIFIGFHSGSLRRTIKKLLGFYLLLLTILLVINWLFNKMPAIWSNANINLNYRDFFHTRTFDKLQNYEHDWFFGGEIIKDASGQIWTVSDRKCVFQFSESNSLPKECTAFQNINNYKHISGSIKTVAIQSPNKEFVYAAFHSKWYTLTSKQIILALNLANKLITIVMLSSTMMMTTTMSDLAYGLEDLFKPLKIFKLPAEELALIIALSIRFTPSLMQESLRIIKAQASRGIDFKNGKIRDKITAILSLFVPLFIVSFIKSDELSSAMIARSYKPKSFRTSYKIHEAKMLDLLIFSVFIIFITFLYCFHFTNSFCGFFGWIEYLLLIAK